jgi:dihydrofolate reductase
MKTILFMATSVNGIIAREDGQEDFLSDYGWQHFVKLSKQYGNFIVGHSTYEITKKYYVGHGLDDLKDIKKIVLSRQKNLNLGSDYIIVTSPPEALKLLEDSGIETALIAGGSVLNTSFAKEKLIDEAIVNIEPVVVGSGRPLFAPENFEFKLALESVEKYEVGGVTLHYKVVK